MNRIFERSRSLSTLVFSGFLASVAACPAADNPPPLPLKRVVMLNSGVAFFEHRGEIEGNRQVEFPVKADDINDLLKSLVVQDRGGGRVASVNYGSPQPIAQTLKTLAIDVTRSPTLTQILQQMRGQSVELAVSSDTKPVIGAIIGIEHRKLLGRDQLPIDTEHVLVRTDAGIRVVAIESIRVTKFLDEKVNREFEQALDLLAESRKQDQKLVKLDLRGEKQREVSVGYVQESPVWKTTYRLVLDEEKPPFLQGWAIVENTTAQDWNEVDLTLISGRPISFQMDLYQPLFTTRPVAKLELHTSVEPRVYNQDLAARDQEFRAQADDQANASRKKPTGMPGMPGGGGMGGGMGGGFFGGGAGAAASPVKTPGAIDLTQGVAAAATTDDLGELFRYVIKTPVSLRRNESALLPIVNSAIKGDKVYVFNNSVHTKHPLSGLKLINSTDLHLQQGPITVFEGDEYAGDAQIADIPPGSTRLITYAMDLDTEVVTEEPDTMTVLEGMRIYQGGLILRKTSTRKTTYLVKNSGSKSKTVLVEQPIEEPWEIVGPKPTEKTRDLYRFAIVAEPGKPAQLEIQETVNRIERLVIQNFDIEKVDLYSKSDKASPRIREALQQFMRRKQALANLTAARSAIEAEIQASAGDQQRLRENLKALGETDALHQRYVQKLAASEDILEKLKPQLSAALAEEAAYRKDFEKSMVELSAE
jgi:hypothetical protein